MLHRSTQLALALFLSLLATGCKVALTVTSGGDVTSLTGNRDCAGGSLCEYEVTDTSFVDSFTAVPRPGYVFSKWQGGDDYQCAESTNPTCTISTNLIESFQGPARGVADTIIASGRYYYVQPLFTFVGIDTDEDGTKDYLDPDDDNDGVLDADDNCPLEGPNLDGFGCPAVPKTVFMTSESYSGNLGGLAGADQKCNALAATAGLSGTYMAWLSVGTESPSTRFTRSTVAYILVDGTVVADDWDDLVDGALLSPILQSETGVDHPQEPYPQVWTNTTVDGLTVHQSACGHNSDGFTKDHDDPGFPTGTGRSGSVGSQWTDTDVLGKRTCDSNLRLYCFEQ